MEKDEERKNENTNHTKLKPGYKNIKWRVLNIYIHVKMINPSFSEIDGVQMLGWFHNIIALYFSH
jgi:hypothetical protein